MNEDKRLKYLGFAGGTAFGLVLARIADGGFDLFLVCILPAIALSAGVVWLHRRHSTIQNPAPVKSE